MLEYELMENNRKIPTTIFTGFLGSGKTTIISHLIDFLISQNLKVAYIKNEIGSEDVDGKLIRGKHIETKELLNGCICCTLTGPFYFAISELVNTVKPDRIIIEASGVASPAAIALLVSSHTQIYRDGLISIIDVVNFEGYKDLSLTAQEQAKLTDLVVFNKVELVNIDRKQAVVGFIRELNEYAPIVEAPVGILNPELAFGLDTKIVNQMLKSNIDAKYNHIDRENIETFSLNVDQPVKRDKIIYFLNELPRNYIRVKGVIALSNGEKVLVNKVGVRSDLKNINSDETIITTKLVFIGFNLEIQKEIVISKFKQLFK
jgi:G3E family GTPase